MLYNDSMFYSNGLYFKCTQCSACCRHTPGIVRLSERDINNLTEFLGLGVNEFLQKFCRSIYNPQGYRSFSLIETAEYDCIFWDGGCTVYEARPVQCRTYPFWSSILRDQKSWDDEAMSCPGIGSGDFYSAEKVNEIRKQYEDEYYD
ncbi:MAG: YkgJ family cysteine cluster protein [Spirochaetales bacterium]|nr:YkgJ family cysteine cluster protein [Spirochaetales bacterium]